MQRREGKNTLTARRTALPYLGTQFHFYRSR